MHKTKHIDQLEHNGYGVIPNEKVFNRLLKHIINQHMGTCIVKPNIKVTHNGLTICREPMKVRISEIVRVIKHICGGPMKVCISEIGTYKNYGGVSSGG